jgi:hypothetical protein
MGLLTRAQLDNLELKREEIDVPEWGGSVLIREMTGSERDHYEAMISGTTVNTKSKTKQLNLENIRARLVAVCLIDENGQRLYKDNEVYLLGKLGVAGLNRVFDACCVLSGISDEDKNELEETVKNSLSEANGVSGSV